MILIRLTKLLPNTTGCVYTPFFSFFWIPRSCYPPSYECKPFFFTLESFALRSSGGTGAWDTCSTCHQYLSDAEVHVTCVTVICCYNGGEVLTNKFETPQWHISCQWFLIYQITLTLVYVRFQMNVLVPLLAFLSYSLILSLHLTGEMYVLQVITWPCWNRE